MGFFIPAMTQSRGNGDFKFVNSDHIISWQPRTEEATLINDETVFIDNDGAEPMLGQYLPNFGLNHDLYEVYLCDHEYTPEELAREDSPMAGESLITVLFDDIEEYKVYIILVAQRGTYAGFLNNEGYSVNLNGDQQRLYNKDVGIAGGSLNGSQYFLSSGNLIKAANEPEKFSDTVVIGDSFAISFGVLKRTLHPQYVSHAAYRRKLKNEIKTA